ncbi:MAG: pseudaminic acid synthase [Butyrivibrio sp.]|nr:pseudaminic acid synthase [Butyrivibrio sp.]
MSQLLPEKSIKLGEHVISKDSSVYIVAEMSANHLGDYNRALEIVHAAKEAGADAIKLQTYTADTMTIDSDKSYFQIEGGTLWDGTTLYKLYKEAYMPWEWHQGIMDEAKKVGIDCFSSPFDKTAVDLMMGLDMPAIKIASYEITDIPFIRYCASQHKPIIFATGVARESDIKLAVDTCLQEGNGDIILLKCVSAYPTPYEEVNLNMIPTLAEKFGCVMGLSDHTMGGAVAEAAVALGARMVEKHLTLRRSDGGADGAFSMEPEEFALMVKNIRIIEKALGRSEYFLSEKQEKEREGARSLYVVQDIAKGEVLTDTNIRSIRPQQGAGLPPFMYEQVLGKRAKTDLYRGEPLKEGDFE